MVTRVLVPRRRAVAAAAASCLLLLSCSPSQRPQSRSEHANGESSLDDDVESFLARYPAVIKGRFGTSDASPYLLIARPRVTDRPYGPEEGALRSSPATYAGAPHPTELPAWSRVIVRGSVVAIGLPHFNSDDGSFWAPELVNEKGAPNVARRILRDVLFQVEEVWGTRLPEIAPRSLVPFVLHGGHIAVNVPQDVADRLWHGPGGVEIFSEEAPVDLVVGEEAVIFLDIRPILGLYNGRMSSRFELFPAHESGFKYVYKDPATIGLPDESDFDISVSSIRAIIERELGKKTDPHAELGTTTPLPPHPPVNG